GDHRGLRVRPGRRLSSRPPYGALASRIVRTGARYDDCRVVGACFEHRGFVVGADPGVLERDRPRFFAVGVLVWSGHAFSPIRERTSSVEGIAVEHSRRDATMAPATFANRITFDSGRPDERPWHGARPKP